MKKLKIRRCSMNNQFGIKNNDGIRSIPLNFKISYNILISGVLDLPPAQAFIRMYSKDAGFDEKGNFYHVGLTGANLFGTLIGEHDFYIVKLRVDK
jgi:hypothetical protein